MDEFHVKIKSSQLGFQGSQCSYSTARSVRGVSQPRVLEWGSPWDRTHISHIGRWVLYCGANREAPHTGGLLLCGPEGRLSILVSHGYLMNYQK